jgi:hypothetical protein
MEAILLCDELSIHFPMTYEKLEEAANDFESLSTNGVIGGCVAFGSPASTFEVRSGLLSECFLK